MTAEKFFAQAQDVKLLAQVATMRSLEEVIANFNAGFVASDKDDKSFVERMKSDNALFFNKFKNVITSGSEEARNGQLTLSLCFLHRFYEGLRRCGSNELCRKKNQKSF